MQGDAAGLFPNPQRVRDGSVREASMKKSYEYLLDRWYQGVAMRRTVDYGNPKSVKLYNRGSDIFRKAAKDMGDSYPERVSEFARLLGHEDPYVRLCAAISPAESMPHTVAQLAAVKAVITDHRKTCDRAELTGWTWWLNQPWALPENCTDFARENGNRPPREG